MKYIAYFAKEMYGYYEFEAKDKEKADEIMFKFNWSADFEKELNIKDHGWQMVDLDELKD